MKMKLKKNKKVKVSTIISILLLLVMIGSYFFVMYVNKQILPVLMNQAEVDAKKMALTVMENSVNDDVLNVLKEEDIFIVSNNSDGEVSNIDFNPVVVNKVLNATVKVVNENLKKIENGNIDNMTYINKENYNIKKLKSGVISELPIGIVTNNALLSNIGPKIPVKLNMIGTAVGNIYTDTKSYGINSAIVEVYAHVEVTERVVIPFSSKEIKVYNNVPIAIKIVQGKVPEYYGGLNNNSSSISIPIDNN